MAKKGGHAEEHENMERWLISYADLLTLLFAFFVVMFALANADQETAQTTYESIAFAFQWSGATTPTTSTMSGAFEVPSGQSMVIIGGRPDGRPQPISPVQEIKEEIKKSALNLVMESLTKNIEKKLIRNKKQGIVKIFKLKGAVVLRLPAEELFTAGSATINPRYFPVMDDIFKTMRNKGLFFRVEGHTDSNAPGSSSQFATNLELSSRRSVNIAHYLISTNSAKENDLSVMGFGSIKPIVPNNSKKNRKLNRRIEIRVFFRGSDMHHSDEQ